MKKKLLKIARLLLWVILISAFGIGIVFAHKKQQAVLLRSIDIEVDEKHSFVTLDEIRAWLQSKKIIKNTALSSVNTYSLEESLRVNPYIKNSRVYSTLEGNLYVHIQQREPLVRIFNLWKEDFYLDENGFSFPSSNQYTARVLVVSGNINRKVNDNASFINIKNIVKDSISDNIILEIFKMARYINSSPFWSKQIAMIYVNEHKEFELTTLVGNQKVLFGNTMYMEEKFDKLRTLYQEGLSRSGWDLYEKIDVRFKNQIICQKKL
jgi:cell division protein FtsQ